MVELDQIHVTKGSEIRGQNFDVERLRIVNYGVVYSIKSISRKRVSHLRIFSPTFIKISKIQKI